MKNIRKVTKEEFYNENSVEVGKHIKGCAKGYEYYLYDKREDDIANILKEQENQEYNELKNKLLCCHQEEELLNSLGIINIRQHTTLDGNKARFIALHKKRGN